VTGTFLAMSITAISSSPAASATAGATATRSQTAAGGSAVASVSASIASTSLQLNAKAQALISKLKQQDADPGHQQGQAASDASYTYGPGGVSSTGADNLQINTSPGHTPEAAIARAHAIEAAALAPAFPSSADRAVAVQAEQLAAQAQAALDAQQAQNPLQASVPVAQPPQTSTVNPVTAAGSVNKAYAAQSATGPSLDTYA